MCSSDGHAFQSVTILRCFFRIVKSLRWLRRTWYRFVWRVAVLPHYDRGVSWSHRPQLRREIQTSIITFSRLTKIVLDVLQFVYVSDHLAINIHCVNLNLVDGCMDIMISFMFDGYGVWNSFYQCNLLSVLYEVLHFDTWVKVQVRAKNLLKWK